MEATHLLQKLPMDILTESYKQQKKGRRLLLFPAPLQGHINPMLQLAKILYSRGFSITIVHTNFNSIDPSDHPYFTFRSISDGLSEKEASAYTEDFIATLVALNVSCADPFRDFLANFISDDSEEPLACLITDDVWDFIGSVADSFRVPWIVFPTSSVTTLFVMGALPLLRDKGYKHIKDYQSNETIPELLPLKVKDYPEVETRNPEDFFHLMDKMFNNPKGSSGIIWNSFEDLEQDALFKSHEIFRVPQFPIGPFHKYFQASSHSSLIAHDESAISWLDSQAPKSVLYVSFGSLAIINETEFLEIAWGLANSKQPFLWVVRPGSVQGSKWLEPLPNEFHHMTGERGHIVKWAPQLEVLAHPAIGGFWTHCGWNSTLESMCEGVPLLCQPSFADQLINARYASEVWKIGIHLENKIERGEIEKAIERLMVCTEGQELRERMMCLKEKLDICLKQGGSSHQSLDSLINYILSF